MRRTHLVVVGAVMLGALTAAARTAGSDPGTALHPALSTLSNLSAPWVVLPFVAGTCARRRRGGAGLGLLTTMVGLVAFYVTTGLTSTSAVGGRTGLSSVPLWVLANQVYFQAGLLTGPLLGGLGAAWRQRGDRAGGGSGRTREGTCWVAALLLVGEPLVLLALGWASPLTEPWRDALPPLLSLPLVWGLVLDRPLAGSLVYAAEMTAGLALAAVLLRRLLHRDRPQRRCSAG